MKKDDNNYSISLYTSKDCEGVSYLLESNTVRFGGTLTSDYSQENIRKMSEIYTIVVAHSGEEVVGVLMALDKHHKPLKPLWVSVLEIWRGEEDAFLYGPVCISDNHKGKRLVGQLWDFMKEYMGGREAILSIQESNEASLRAHRRIGMRQVGEFKDGKGNRLIFTSRPKVFIDS